MQISVGFLLSIVVSSAVASPAFETKTTSIAELSNLEVQRYERLKKAPGVVRTKLITVNENAFSQGAWVYVPLFDGLLEGFRISKNKQESVWKGKGKQNSDRFVIRRVGELYSGHILLNGRRYVLIPAKKRVSLLQELSGGIDCGLPPEINGRSGNDAKEARE